MDECRNRSDRTTNRVVHHREYKYETVGGDIVIQNDELFAPIASHIEGQLLYGKVIAPFLWKHFVSDRERLSALLDCLEQYIQASMRESFAAFMDTVGQRHAIQKTWRLGVPLSDPQASMGVGHALGKPVAPNPPGTAQQGQTSAGDADTAAILTPREREVCDLVVRGLSDGEIATQLGLSLNTVKNHACRLFERFGVNSRSELTYRVMGQHQESTSANAL